MKNQVERVELMEAKSIHILACPFRFGSERTEIQGFMDEVEENGWKFKDITDMDFLKDSELTRKRENFMRYQYFSGSARNIFCAGKKGSCRIFEYGNVLDYSYYIKCREKEYKLPIDEIEMHLYDCGVGVLFVRFLNKEYTSIADIEVINDYSRRVMLPFLPSEPDGVLLCAEKIGIYKNEDQLKDEKETGSLKDVCISDFRWRVQQRKKLNEQADFIEELIFHHLEKEGLCTPQRNIEYYTDDRLLLLCVLRDKQLSETLKKGMDQLDKAEREQLYRLIYVDCKDTSCQDGRMQKELLQEAIYPRWSGWGTIHAATSYSMLCITGESSGANEGVVRPFVIEYTYIFSLVLAQKYAISKFSEIAGKAVGGIEEKGVIGPPKTDSLTDLQEEYVAFKNKLMILEVTPQEQGIEIYHLLKKQFRIADEQAILDEQLESLYEIINTSNGERLNKAAFWIAVLAIGIQIACTIAEILWG